MNDLGLTKYSKTIIDFFLPRFCLSCSSKLNKFDDTICKGCLTQIETADEKRIKTEFERKFLKDKIIDAFYSPFVFEKDKTLQNVIHALKYNSNIKAGKFLGQLLYNNSSHILKEWNADITIPIPLHKVKKAERGYNQSYYISKELAILSNCKLKSGIIIRNRFTESQTNFNLDERKKNISNAFYCKNAKRIKDKNVMLVDDVITTGSTIKECGKVLKEKGAKKVFALSIAIAD